MNPALVARRTVAVFPLEGRALVEVRGADRVRFLQGQLSNDVAGLRAGQGCYALLLTLQGRIVADLHVLARDDAIWLETARTCVAAALARLARYVVADDVAMGDRSDDFARFAVEGPGARALLEEVGGGAAPSCEAWAPLQIAGVPGVAGAWGVSGETAFQIFAPAERTAEVEAALRDAVTAAGGVVADPATLEILRVEAGTPAAGHELTDDALPAETGLLERTVSFTKGCYTGQEVVARMASRGRHAHDLVGLRWEGDAPPPAAGATVERDGKKIGDVTSSALSPTAGAIGLAYVRRKRAGIGDEVRAGDRLARLAALPFVAPGEP